MFSAKQDMPPPGGYEKIVYERNPGRVLFKGRYILLAYLGISGLTTYLYAQKRKTIFLDRQERQGGINAIFPFLLAERDRAYLKRLHWNREQERELMKDVEGWEVGTFYGEPIYKTIDLNETWVDPILEDFYVNVKNSDYFARAVHGHQC